MPPPDDPGHRLYWRRNIRLLAILLTIWFTVSFGLGILLAGPLNEIRLLGFWIAQQGSLFVFVGIVWFYVWRMNRLDRAFGVDEQD
jgi:putative solute:sodium symporter small subunit